MTTTKKMIWDIITQVNDNANIIMRFICDRLLKGRVYKNIYIINCPSTSTIKIQSNGDPILGTPCQKRTYFVNYPFSFPLYLKFNLPYRRHGSSIKLEDHSCWWRIFVRGSRAGQPGGPSRCCRSCSNSSSLSKGVPDAD